MQQIRRILGKGKEGEPQTQQSRAKAENHDTPSVEQRSQEVDAIVEELKTERGNVVEESLADFAWGDVRDLRRRQDRLNRREQNLRGDLWIGSSIRGYQPTQQEVNNLRIDRDLVTEKLHDVLTLQSRYPKKYGEPFEKVYGKAEELDGHIGRQETSKKLKEIVDNTPVKPKPQQPQQ